MTFKPLLVLACLVWCANACADDHVTKIMGHWRIDRLLTGGVDRLRARQAIVSFDDAGSGGLLRGSVSAGNMHTFVFRVEGRHLVNACGAGIFCTSTMLGLHLRRIGAPATPAELAATESVAKDDEYLGKLFTENDAYWIAGASGIALGFVMADTRIELSRYTAPAASPNTL